MAEETDTTPTADSDGDAAGSDGDADGPLPEGVLAEAERLTRLARDAVDDAEATAYREERASLLADHDYTARVRDDDDVLVLHPDEWVEDGLVQVDRVEDIDRGIEIPLAGPGEADDWEAVADHNERVAEAVSERHGEVHGGNAEMFAAFASNHYAKRVEDVTESEKEEFVTDYYPRNAWPSEEQRAALEESLSLVAAVATEFSGTPG